MDTDGRYENLMKAKDCENATTVVETKEPVRLNMYTRTAIFWDINDFPYPESSPCPGRGYPESHPRPVRTIVDNIKSALKFQGYRYSGCDFSLYAYADKKSVTQKMIHDFIHDASEIFGMEDPGDKRGRLDTILMDMVRWGISNPPIPGILLSNVMLVLKNIPGDPMLVPILQSLKGKGYHVQLVDHSNCAAESEKLPRDLASHVWVWETLIEGGKPVYWSGKSDTYSEEATSQDCGSLSKKKKTSQD